MVDKDWEQLKSARARGAEPVAWVTPLAYGQQVTFYKPPKPEGFEDNEAGVEWYCRPLVYGDTQPQSAGVPEGWKLKRVEGDMTTITITRESDGVWCGGGIKGADGAHGLRYEFLEALMSGTPQSQSAGVPKPPAKEGE